jgi:hypothetical protein
MYSRSPQVSKHRWALLYEEAVSEIDESRRLNLIGLARGAIFQRKREIAQSGIQDVEEQTALAYAAYVLNALRRAAMFNRTR